MALPPTLPEFYGLHPFFKMHGFQICVSEATCLRGSKKAQTK